MKTPKITTNLSGDEIARMVAANACHQLRRSERGLQALIDFRNLVDNGGHALDTANWNALNDLCGLAAAGKTFAIEEQIRAGRRG